MSPFLWVIALIGLAGLVATFWLIQKGYALERENRKHDLGYRDEAKPPGADQQTKAKDHNR